MNTQGVNQGQPDEHDTEVDGHGRAAIPGAPRPAMSTEDDAAESDADVAGHGRAVIPGGGVRPKSQQQESTLVDDAEVVGHGSALPGGPTRPALPTKDDASEE